MALFADARNAIDQWCTSEQNTCPILCGGQIQTQSCSGVSTSSLSRPLLWQWYTFLKMTKESHSTLPLPHLRPTYADSDSQHRQLFNTPAPAPMAAPLQISASTWALYRITSAMHCSPSAVRKPQALHRARHAAPSSRATFPNQQL